MPSMLGGGAPGVVGRRAALGYAMVRSEEPLGYARKRGNQMIGGPMSTATTALIAASLALVGTVATNIVALVNERNRQRKTEEIERTKELRSRTAEAFKHL